MQQEQQNYDQPLQQQEQGKKKKRLNKQERQLKRHQTSINSFSLSERSQIQTGYVGGSDRKPTNCVFLFIFIFFGIAMLGLSIYGFSKGDVKKLVAPQNSDG